MENSEAGGPPGLPPIVIPRGALEMMAMMGISLIDARILRASNRRENYAGDSCCNRAAMQRHAAEHPRAFGTMLDLAIPDERDY